MTYTKKTWVDNFTPLSAENLNNMENGINNNTNEIAKVPYVDYTSASTVDYGKSNKIYEGSSVFAKKTWGEYENACVASIIAGVSNPRPQILGADTQGLTTYTNRDSVALHTENAYLETPWNYSSATFTGTTLTLPSGSNVTGIRVGMICDITNGANKYVGIIASINGLVFTMVNGFMLVVVGTGSTTNVTPLNGSAVVINKINKIWALNSNVMVHGAIPAATGLEIGVFCDHPEINDVGGLDIINFEESTHYGFKARGVTTGFQKGFISSMSGTHFEGNGSASDKPLIQSVNTDATSFVIKNDGEMSKQKYVMQTVTNSLTVGANISQVIIAAASITVTLPLAERGKMLNIYSISLNTTLTAQVGQTIVFPTTTANSILLSATKKVQCVLMGDGTSWFAVSSNVYN